MNQSNFLSERKKISNPLFEKFLKNFYVIHSGEFRSLLTVFFFTNLLSFSSFAQADEPRDWVQGEMESLVSLYRHLHAHPELSRQEEQTSKRFAQELKAVGAEVTERIGGFGVVGLLRNGTGPT